MSTEAFYVAYSTAEQVVGLLSWPLDGNPQKTLGLIAHPGPIVGISLSHDSCKLVTAGGADGSVMVWQVHLLQTISCRCFSACLMYSAVGVRAREDHESGEEEGNGVRRRVEGRQEGLHQVVICLQFCRCSISRNSASVCCWLLQSSVLHAATFDASACHVLP